MPDAWLKTAGMSEVAEKAASSGIYYATKFYENNKNDILAVIGDGVTSDNVDAVTNELKDLVTGRYDVNFVLDSMENIAPSFKGTDLAEGFIETFNFSFKKKLSDIINGLLEGTHGAA
jgi:hypothetical protein